MDKKASKIGGTQNAINLYPPVVSVLGHVDHGKTSLLDAIRKTNVVLKEKGGITQKIGASSIETPHEGKKRKITFIDTPGHDAFANMRSQGVFAADIVLLVVDASDEVKPQTRESIKKILESKLPYIVVFTKIDLPTANIVLVQNQLLKEGVLLEGLGGDTPFIGVSAKTGEKIKDLLDLILLVYDIGAQTKNEQEEFKGIVIESKLEKGKGYAATVIVKSGKLSIGDFIYSQEEVGKVKNLIGPDGLTRKVALPGDAVEVLGAREVMAIGTILVNKKVIKKAIDAPVAKEKLVFNPAEFFKDSSKSILRIILKTEGTGEMEAIKAALPKEVEIISEGQGEILPSDILLAKDMEAVIIGFNTGITKEAKILAESNNTVYKIYGIIYELIDEIKDFVNAAILVAKEEVTGKATVIASFDIAGTRILGVRVQDKNLKIGDKVKIMRGLKLIGKGKIASIKRGKEDVREVAKGLECGLIILPVIDFSKGDVVLSYNTKDN